MHILDGMHRMAAIMRQHSAATSINSLPADVHWQLVVAYARVIQGCGYWNLEASASLALQRYRDGAPLPLLRQPRMPDLRAARRSCVPLTGSTCGGAAVDDLLRMCCVTAPWAAAAAVVATTEATTEAAVGQAPQPGAAAQLELPSSEAGSQEQHSSVHEVLQTLHDAGNIERNVAQVWVVQASCASICMDVPLPSTFCILHPTTTCPSYATGCHDGAAAAPPASCAGVDDAL